MLSNISHIDSSNGVISLFENFPFNTPIVVLKSPSILTVYKVLVFFSSIPRAPHVCLVIKSIDDSPLLRNFILHCRSLQLFDSSTVVISLNDELTFRSLATTIYNIKSTGILDAELSSMIHESLIRLTIQADAYTIFSDTIFNPYFTSIQRVGCIVQARMQSTRLPHKAMLHLQGKPIIQTILDRLSLNTAFDYLALSTSSEAADDVLFDFISSKGYPSFRGPEENVAKRFLDIATSNKLTHIVRVTGDDLYRDINSINNMILAMSENNADYMYSDDLILGCNTEIFSTACLEFICKFCRFSEQTSALTWYLDRADIFNVCEFSNKVKTRPQISLMLDTPSDYNSIIMFSEKCPQLLGSLWEYTDLLLAVDSNISCFDFHPIDVGLANRDKYIHSFIFDH